MAYSADSFVFGEQPSAAKWNKLWSNDASFNDGTGIGTNAIAAASLKTNAITLGYAQITSSFVHGSLTVTDITGLSAAVTIPAGGRRVKVTVWGSSWSNTSGSNAVTLYLTDGSNTVLANSRVNAPNNEATPLAPVIFSEVPSAGSKTYKARIANDIATNVSMNAAATSPAFILVEAI